MSHYKPYPKYKDSGVDWVGNIPTHWNCNKLKYIFSEKKITHNPNLECGSISFGEVITKANTSVAESTKASYQEVLKGEFLINPLNLNYDLKSLRIALSEINVVVSSGYIVIKEIIDINKNYYKWLLHIYDISYMKLLGSGVRQTINFNHISNSLLPLPPKAEQTAIAQFLDRKTAEIKAFIALKEKTIALLKERKTAIINQAVTKGLPAEARAKAGLDPNVEMKDSGISWLGEIPKHWEVKKLKYLGFFQNGYAFNSNEFLTKGVRVVKIANVHTMRFDWQEESFISDKYFDKLPEYRILKGDLVIALTRPIISSGIKAVISDRNESLLLNQRNAIFRASKSVHQRWIYYTLLNPSFVDEFDKRIDKTGQQPNISTNEIASIKMTITSENEQALIVDYLDMKMIEIDQSISQAEKEITLIKEYQQSLISEAVTGKIDVRGEVVNAYPEQESAMGMAAEGETQYGKEK